MALRIVQQTKRRMAERILGQTLGKIGNDPDRGAQLVLKAIDRITDNEKQAIISDWAHNWFQDGKPGRDFLSRLLKNTHPNVRRRYVARMLVSWFYRDPQLAERCMHEYGITPPYTMLVSPTMRCNFCCKGCFAASYTRDSDMKPELLDRIITEAEAMGINFIIILGGEPLMYPHLLPIIKKHNRSYFQLYTNGVLIDKAMAKKLVELGNVAPQVSINGPREHTEASRGKGSYDHVMRAMDNLREAGCVFGFSATMTRDNIEPLYSDEWMNLMIEKGCLYGWMFLYMPVGGDPDINLMPTPQQRNELRKALRYHRQTKPILPVDFWNDGTLVGGCIAGGRLYFHVNHHGDVEPCVFCHHATHNLNDCSLAEALASPFFTGIKQSQPFSYNTLRPCPMIDNPEAMRSLIAQHGARPTHEGADLMFTKLAPDLDRYAAGVKEIMDEVWEREDYHDWAARWTGMCGIPPERLEARRQEFEADRARKRNHVLV